MGTELGTFRTLVLLSAVLAVSSTLVRRQIADAINFAPTTPHDFTLEHVRACVCAYKGAEKMRGSLHRGFGAGQPAI